MEGTRSEKAVVSVEVFRKTRYTQLSKLPNKKAKTKEKILTKKLKVVTSLQKSQRPVVRSITADNGSENTNHQKMSKALDVKFFFCQPYPNPMAGKQTQQHAQEMPQLPDAKRSF